LLETYVNPDVFSKVIPSYVSVSGSDENVIEIVLAIIILIYLV